MSFSSRGDMDSPSVQRNESMTSEVKTGVQQLERMPDPSDEEIMKDVVDSGGHLGKEYYLSPLFLGSYMACGLGLMAGQGAFALAAPNLGVISDDLHGSPGSITWAAIVFVLMQGIGSTLIGRVTDIFGRRWFFVGGSVLGLIGDIVCSRAQTVPTLIGGYTMVGASVAVQGSFAFVIGELVPIRWRFLANAGLYLMGSPFYMLGPKIGTILAYDPSRGWRWIFYIMIIFNGASTICWYLFYHPPTFLMLHHGRESKRRLIMGFDYIGFALFTGGLTLLFLGLNWGGSLYAWNSARVLCVLIIGGASVAACFAYEYIVAPKDPYIPLGVFRNRQYDAVTATMAVVAMAYYGFSIIWPTMVSTLYPATISTLGWKFCAASGMIVLGDFVGLALASFIRRLRYFMVACMLVGTAFTGAVAVATQHNQALTVSLMAIGCFFLGVVEAIAITLSGIAIDDQNDIGTAVGIAASIRSLAGALASTVYSTILANRLKQTIPALVPEAVTRAGLPASEIPALLQVFQGILSSEQVPGLTNQILSVGLEAYQTANAQAYRTCFLTSIAFCALGVVAACFCPDLNPETEHLVAKKLHRKADEQHLEHGTLEKA